MTETPQRYEIEDFYSSAHPIRRFAAGLVAIAVALLAIWWTGLLAPRLSAQVESGRHDGATGRGILRLALSNDAPLPVQLQALTLDLGDASTVSVTLDGEPVASHPELPRTSSRLLVIEYQTDECPVADHGPVRFVKIEVETPLGLAKQESLPLSPIDAPDARTC